MTQAPRALPSLSVAVSSAALLSGCLDDPPEYTAPARIPPVVAYSQVEPPLSVIVPLEAGQDQLSVTVPFRSEDLESPIVATFFLDAQPGQDSAERLNEPFIVPASSFEVQGRSLQVVVSGLGELIGCHTMTLVMTHQSNTNRFTGERIDEGLAVRLDWWLAAPGEDDIEIPLSDCPTLGGQTATGVSQ